MGFKQEPRDEDEREERHEGRVDAAARLRQARPTAPPSEQEQGHADQDHRPEEVAQEEVGS